MNSVIRSDFRAQDVVFCEKIGEGAHAEVWKVQELALPKRFLAAKVVAVRFAERNEPGNQKRIDRIREQEITHWSKLGQSPHVMPLYGAINDKVLIDGENYLIVGSKMPLAELGDLGKYLETNQLKLQGRKELARFLCGIAHGVKTAHDVNIAHCDIKASNILLFMEGAEIIPRIMDFGISVGTNVGHLEGGTPEYMAPEQFARGASMALDQAKKADVYSLGVLFYQILCRKLPFQVQCDTQEERWELYKAFHNHDEPDYELVKERSSEEMAFLVEQMLKKKPGDRIEIYKIVKELERQENAYIVATWTEQEIPCIVSESTYRWNVNVHKILGNQLCYYLVRGRQVPSDLDWFKNNLSEQNIHGYSFYRVLGGYDYLLRIWLKAPYVTIIGKMLDQFTATKGGSYISFAGNYVRLFENSNGLDIASREDLFGQIYLCADKDPENEFCSLREVDLVTSRLEGENAGGIRFFVLFNSASKVSDYYCQMLANDLRERLLSGDYGLSQLSVYTGGGDFIILIKFRLSEFVKYKNIVSLFGELVSNTRNEADLHFDTFIEMDEHAYIESDDGSIVREASAYAARLF